MSTNGLQFDRVANLIVNSAVTGQGLDLSNLRFRFQVRQSDQESPNFMVVRVYNLSDEHRDTIVSEYDRVSLQCGYAGIGPSIIFSGTIKQFEKGKESNVDTYLEITAADGDVGYNFGVLNVTLAPGATGGDVVKQAAAAMNLTVDQSTINFAATGGVVHPRGKVLWGLARLSMRNLADTIGARWSIQNGKLVLIPLTSYLPGDVVVVNSATGMIGQPAATQDGVEVRLLLNPNVKIGQRLQLDNRDITTTTVREFGRGSVVPAGTSYANLSTDGIYRVLVAEHSGDTRELEWYTDVVALAIDRTSPQIASVRAYP